MYIRLRENTFYNESRIIFNRNFREKSYNEISK